MRKAHLLMAIDMSKQRVLIGLLILFSLWLPVLFTPSFRGVVLHFPPYWTYIVISVPLLFLAAWEWSKIAGLESTRLRLGYAGFTAIIFLGLSYWLHTAIPLFSFILMGLSTLGWFVVAVYLYSISRKQSLPPIPSKWTKVFLGFFVLLPFWILLYTYDHNNTMSLYGTTLLLLIWLIDICARRLLDNIRIASWLLLAGMIMIASTTIGLVVWEFLGFGYSSILKGMVFFSGWILMIVGFALIGKLFKNFVVPPKGPDDVLILDTIGSVAAAFPVTLFLYGALLLGTGTFAQGWQELLTKCTPGVC
jgi:hypothetical protein